MNFKDDTEYKQFIEIAAHIKYYKAKGVPIPKEVVDMIETNKNSSDVFYVLNDMLKEWNGVNYDGF